MPSYGDPKTHYNELQRYLVAYHAKTPSSSRSNARQKLTRLAKQQLHELTADVYDELMRRKTNPPENLEALPPCQEFHPKRNQARQKLATLPTIRFQDLSSDIYFELSRRYPELKEENHGEACYDDMQYPECHASPWPDSPTLPSLSRMSRFSKETRVDNEPRSLTFDRYLSEADFARRPRSKGDAHVSNTNRHEVDSRIVSFSDMPRIARQRADDRPSASPSISIYGEMARTQCATAVNPNRMTLAREDVEATHRRKGSQDSWVMVGDDGSDADGNARSKSGEKRGHGVSMCDLNAVNARSKGPLSLDINDEGDGVGGGDDGFDKVSLKRTSMTSDRSSAVKSIDGRVSMRGGIRDWQRRGYDPTNVPAQDKTVTLEPNLENTEQREKALLEAQQRIKSLEEEIDGFRKRAEEHEAEMKELKKELDGLREL